MVASGSYKDDLIGDDDGFVARVDSGVFPGVRIAELHLCTKRKDGSRVDERHIR